MLITVCIFLLCCSIQPGTTNQISDPSWYKTRMINTVIPPYRTAYTTLNDRIVQKLLTINRYSDEASTRTLLNSLVCAAKTVRDNLDQATKASEQIRIDIDNHITTLELSIVNQENQIKQSQQSVNEANINIQHSQQQVILAETAVQDTQNALNTAEHQMQEAQRAVEKARLCGGRRRKRGFGKWWRKRVEKPFVKVVRQTVIKPVCSVVNSGGIDSAKQHRALTENRLREAQQRLSTHNQNLAHQRAQHHTAQTQLNEATTQLHALTSELHQQQAKRSVVTLLTKQFKDIETHLNTVLGSSGILQDEITQLIDFELVFVPLNAIYQEMLSSNVMDPFDFQISANTVAIITKNLKTLSDTLPEIPLQKLTEENTDVACV